MNEPVLLSRRNFLARSTLGLGSLALGHLLGGVLQGAATNSRGPLGLHFPARAKRVIYLFQSGGPSQLELFDNKPDLKARFDQDLPDSIRMGQRITGMVSGQARLPIAPSKYTFRQCGQSGASIGDLLPYTQKNRRRHLSDPDDEHRGDQS